MVVVAVLLSVITTLHTIKHEHEDLDRCLAGGDFLKPCFTLPDKELGVESKNGTSVCDATGKLRCLIDTPTTCLFCTPITLHPGAFCNGKPCTRAERYFVNGEFVANRLVRKESGAIILNEDPVSSETLDMLRKTIDERVV